MRRTSVAVVVSVLISVVAGCASANAPGTPSLSPSATAVPSAVATPTSGASVTVTTPTGTPCPTDSPMTVATYLAADPACFGASDVSLAGWEDVPNGVDPGGSDYRMEPDWFTDPTAAVLADALPGHCPGGPPLAMCQPFLFVHVNPASKLQFERDGAYVEITGHRDDPAAAGCYQVGFDDPSTPPHSPGADAAECAARFVLTSIRDVPPPAGALDFCQVPATFTVGEFQATEEPCIDGRPIRILGYVDAVPAIDFLGATISPSWLASAAGPGVLWSVVPLHVDGNGTCPSAAAPNGGGSGPCSWMFLYLHPASGITIPARHWIIVTGHIDDPAAATCHYVDSGPYGGPIPDAVMARQSCHGSFVVTKVELTAPPVG